MKRFLVLVACLAPTLAFGQQIYTNADLVKLDVPGAYTNDDLRGLPPLAIQRQPAATLPRFEMPQASDGYYQAQYDGLRTARAELAAEMQFENDRVEFSESAFAGSSQGGEPRLGYRTKVRPLLHELTKRIAILDVLIEATIDAARRAGATIDTR